MDTAIDNLVSLVQKATDPDAALKLSQAILNLANAAAQIAHCAAS